MTIWREIRAETTADVTEVLDAVVLKKAPVDELLMDNSATE